MTFDINAFMPPPEGQQWHREHGWKAEDLEGGYRPLLAGECPAISLKDEFASDNKHWNLCNTDYFPETAKSSGFFWRTKRPLPGQEKKEPTDPYSELKKAHSEGKVIECNGVNGRWMEYARPMWSHPVENYRIKPVPEVPEQGIDPKTIKVGDVVKASLKDGSHYLIDVSVRKENAVVGKYTYHENEASSGYRSGRSESSEGLFYFSSYVWAYAIPITPEEPKVEASTMIYNALRLEAARTILKNTINKPPEQQPTETSTMPTLYNPYSIAEKQKNQESELIVGSLASPPPIGSRWAVICQKTNLPEDVTIKAASASAVRFEGKIANELVTLEDWNKRKKTELPPTKRELKRQAKQNIKAINAYTEEHGITKVHKPSLTRRAVHWLIVKPLKVAAMLTVGAFLSSPIKAGIIGGTAYLWNYVSEIVQK